MQRERCLFLKTEAETWSQTSTNQGKLLLWRAGLTGVGMPLRQMTPNKPIRFPTNPHRHRTQIASFTDSRPSFTSAFIIMLPPISPKIKSPPGDQNSRMKDDNDKPGATTANLQGRGNYNIEKLITRPGVSQQLSIQTNDSPASSAIPAISGTSSSPWLTWAEQGCFSLPQRTSPRYQRESG